MSLSPILSDSEHQAALAEISVLMDVARGPGDCERLARLADVIEAYERVHYPVAEPTAAEAVMFRVQESGMSVDDLIPLIGSAEEVDGFLAGKAGLTEDMVERLVVALGIPSSILGA